MDDGDNPFGDDTQTEVSLEPANEDTPSHESMDAVSSYNDLIAPPSFGDVATEEPSEPEPAPPASPDAVPSAPKPQAALEVTVGEPLKQPDKDSLLGGTFVTYKVETKTSMEQFKKGDFAVRRRFREFVALAERLDHSHRGYFIPPRPEKNVVEGKLHSSEFVEVRRVALQKYLQKLARHPVLSKSRELQLFLEWESDIGNCGEWKEMEHGGFREGLSNLPKQILGNERSIPSTEEAAQAGEGRNLIRGFKELRQKLKNKMGGKAEKASGLEGAVDTDAADELKGEKLKLKKLEGDLAAASSAAEHVIQRMEKLANAVGDFGLSAIKTSKFEEEEGARSGKYSASGEPIREVSAQMKTTGTQCVRMSRLARSATENTAAQLSHIHDYLGLMPGAFAALRGRDAAKLTLQTLSKELASKEVQVVQLEAAGQEKFGGSKNNTRKVFEMKQDIEALKEAKQAAQQEHAKIQDRNQEELTRFAQEKQADLMAMALGFAKIQQALSERSAKIWRDTTANLSRRNTEVEEGGEKVINTENPLLA